MTTGVPPGATAGAGVAAAAMIQALRASGVIVRVAPEEFLRLLERQETPLVVVAPPAGVFRRKWTWLMPWRGLAFACTTAREIRLPATADVVRAKTIWLP